MQSSSPRAGRARGLAVEYPPWWDIILILVIIVIVVNVISIIVPVACQWSLMVKHQVRQALLVLLQAVPQF